MNKVISISIVFVISSVLISCKNTEAELYAYEVSMEETTTIIDHKNSTIEVSFPKHIRYADDLSAKFSISDGADAFVNRTLQISEVSKNNYEAPFDFTVVSEDELARTTWKVRSVNNDYTRAWGLGGFLHKDISMYKPYEWYIDQSQTGTFSDFNCAPTCVVMASLWQDADFTRTVEDARHLYNPSGGGWTTHDIGHCLDDFNTNYEIAELSDYRDETLEILVNRLEEGNIILMAIDVHYLEESLESEVRINKYYETIQLGTGHCIILKGLKVVDGNTFFEVYDPIGYDYKYNDGSYKGKNRYYRSDDIYTAAFASWNFAFVILGPYNKKSAGEAVDLSETPSILVL